MKDVLGLIGIGLLAGVGGFVLIIGFATNPAVGILVLIGLAIACG